MSPRLVMKRLQSNCPAQRTSQRPPSDSLIPELFRKAVGRMPLELVEPVEKMLSRSSQRRPTSQLFALVSFEKILTLKVSYVVIFYEHLLPKYLSGTPNS
ncbi:hypothetical protein T265_06967 [Opisthorchis viverrini]|uniref:Uncharacterized protein n=1 Tax=Opisthorchis viverrini TaxID=6198 RepID=A0A074ZEC3_OPIVI|nr:hypothetical protein T265_06967 [Opisthorchis viverrini]KER25621.1 hypothetical protein T265_06967 [Opisthorchis viverrini]